MNQEERLNYLVKEFIRDSIEHRNVEVPEAKRDKQVVLRSLMNVRMPRFMDADVVRIQDEYLKERAMEKGIVTLQDIPTIGEALGSTHFFADKLSIWQGDITRLAVGAIVNAANSRMLGCFVPMHACIDNCIHTYAGIQLRAACNSYMERMRMEHGNYYEEPTGQAMLTDAYNLPADYVIHTVGPIVQNQLSEELRKELAHCYENIMQCCLDNQIRSVAFCCISTGVFHFPNEEAANIAIHTVSDFLKVHGEQFERVIFNVYQDKDRRIYEGLV